jgi:hypothetical protein
MKNEKHFTAKLIPARPQTSEEVAECVRVSHVDSHCISQFKTLYTKHLFFALAVFLKKVGTNQIEIME